MTQIDEEIEAINAQMRALDMKRRSLIVAKAEEDKCPDFVVKGLNYVFFDEKNQEKPASMEQMMGFFSIGMFLSGKEQDERFGGVLRRIPYLMIQELNLTQYAACFGVGPEMLVAQARVEQAHEEETERKE